MTEEAAVNSQGCPSTIHVYCKKPWVPEWFWKLLVETREMDFEQANMWLKARQIRAVEWAIHVVDSL